MPDRIHLLPVSSTNLEKRTSESADRLPILKVGTDNLRSFKYVNVQESIWPWLVAEYGLGEINSLLPVPQEAVEKGIPWQRMRGTPEAVLEAFRWLGETVVIHEESNKTRNWWWYQIEYDNPILEKLLIPSALAGKLSEPLRSRMARGFWLYDMGISITSDAKFSGPYLVGDWSGTQHHVQDGPDWSFGREIGSILEPAILDDFWEDEVWDAATWESGATYPPPRLIGNPLPDESLMSHGPTDVGLNIDLEAHIIGQELLVGYAPGDPSWDGVKPPAYPVDPGAYDPSSIYGYRKCKPSMYVSDGANPYQTTPPWDEFTPSMVPTTKALVEFETQFGDFDDQEVREIVVFTGPTFAETPLPGKRRFTPAEVTDPGTPLYIWRLPKIFLSEVIRERTYLVFEVF